MDEVAAKACKNELVDVSPADDILRISPLKKTTPPSAVAFAEKAYSLIPQVKITEVLGEVDGWTRLAERFVHMRTLAPPKHRQALLTAVLADGINLGLTRMAEACRATPWRQLTWTADWHTLQSQRGVRAREWRGATTHPSRFAEINPILLGLRPTRTDEKAESARELLRAKMVHAWTI